MTRYIFQNIIKQVDSLSNVREDRVVGKPKYLRAMIGTGKGCFKTPQEADEFIRKERDKWSLSMQFAVSESIMKIWYNSGVKDKEIGVAAGCGQKQLVRGDLAWGVRNRVSMEMTAFCS